MPYITQNSLVLNIGNDSTVSRENPKNFKFEYSSRMRFIFLVHGFDNNKTEATRNYESFVKQLNTYTNKLDNDIFGIYWPGYSRKGIWGLRKFYYPKAVKNAKLICKNLAEYLSKKKGPNGSRCKVILIGHSLGCRLILEALTELSRRKSYNKIDTFLLAAAVPVEYVIAGGRLGSGVQLASKSYVFYSQDDRTLFRYFEIGQMFSSGEVFNPEPIGLYGNPSYGIWDERIHMKGFDHSDYWIGDRIVRKLTAIEFIPIQWKIQKRTDITVRQINQRIDPGTIIDK